MTARSIIQACLLWLRDPFQDFHDDAKMLIYLNQAIQDIAERSNCIESWGHLPVVKDVYRYALPDDFLEAKIVGFDSKDIGWYPLGSEKDQSVVSLARWRYDPGPGYPSSYAIGGNAVIERLIANVTVARDAGLTVEFGSNPLTFGIKVGDRFLNVNDGSEAEVITVTATQVDTTVLDFGETNVTEVGDTIRIVSAFSPLKSINLAPSPGTTSATGEEPLSLYFSRSHGEITQEHIDNENDNIELDLQFRPALEQRVCEYGSAAQYGKRNAQTYDFRADYEMEYKKAWPRVNKKMRGHALQWVKNMRRWPRQATVTGQNLNLGNPLVSTSIDGPPQTPTEESGITGNYWSDGREQLYTDGR